MTANDGLEGLKLVRENSPDLILMDIWMPVGIGFSVAQRLQAIGLGGIPIIFITASKQKGLKRIAHNLGAVGFFEKPYDSRELMAAIATMLAQSTLSAALVSARNPNLQNPKARYEKNTDCGLSLSEYRYFGFLPERSMPCAWTGAGQPPSAYDSAATAGGLFARRARR